MCATSVSTRKSAIEATNSIGLLHKPAGRNNSNQVNMKGHYSEKNSTIKQDLSNHDKVATFGRIVDVNDDGNCWFHSLIGLLHQNKSSCVPNSITSIRKKMYDYVNKNRDKVLSYLNIFFQNGRHRQKK